MPGPSPVVAVFIVVIVAWLLIVALSAFVINLWNASNMTSTTNPTQNGLRWAGIIILSLSFILPVVAGVYAYKAPKSSGPV